MTPGRMKELMNMGIHPLIISRVKWVDIAKRNGADKGTHNCALCAIFPDTHESVCHGCFIANWTNDSICRSTPYENWEHHISHGCILCPRPGYSIEGADDYCPRAKELAQKEVDFLTKLIFTLPKEDLKKGAFDYEKYRG